MQRLQLTEVIVMLSLTETDSETSETQAMCELHFMQSGTVAAAIL